MTIDRYDEGGGTLLICAVRYALGRLSYMPGLVMMEITPMIKDLSYSSLFIMRNDIREYLDTRTETRKRDMLDDYQKEWSTFLQQLETELKLRQKENACV